MEIVVVAVAVGRKQRRRREKVSRAPSNTAGLRTTSPRCFFRGETKSGNRNTQGSVAAAFPANKRNRRGRTTKGCRCRSGTTESAANAVAGKGRNDKAGRCTTGEVEANETPDARRGKDGRCLRLGRLGRRYPLWSHPQRRIPQHRHVHVAGSHARPRCRLSVDLRLRPGRKRRGLGKTGAIDPRGRHPRGRQGHCVDHRRRHR
mmetsp:Transcript_8910/g.19243  ORF Transcript_8910/g.19243 Transcript_8910/m.19243 type:complete len:204 (+) Transcript_8910:358-969(+)